MMIRHSLILFVFSLSALSGCAFITPTPKNPEIMRAESLLDSGKNKEAAVIYQQLATANSEQQNQYRLLAADALIRANDIKPAKQYIASIDVSALDEAQLGHLSLLQAQIDLSQGDAETAMTRLKAIQVQPLNNRIKIAYYQSLAFAHSLTGDALQSAQALINSDSYINSPIALNKNHVDILAALSRLSADALQIKQAADGDILNGWMSLASVFKLGDANLNENLAQWRKANSTHPSNSAFLAQYVKNYQANLSQAGLIAVFLPESGAYSAPAAVIKKGFMTAYQLAKKNGATSSEIRFYDTEKNSAADLYQQAIKDGARLVVGPLKKEDIRALTNSADLPIPVLALNHVEGLNFPKLYQFALSPIDDAEQITLKARHDGHQNALFLVAKSEQGKRFGSYFSDNWLKLGAGTFNVQSYDDTKTDFSAFALGLVKTDSSLELKKISAPEMKKASSLAPSKTEFDAIILSAYAKPARLLYPQLRKNKSTADLPVYATALVYLGDADAARDKNLDGLTFCDVPWVFSEAYPGELSKFTLLDSWKDLPPSYLRLLPMGIDAYNLISHLNELKTQTYSGATGKLKLDSDNRISRELYCAKFVDGVPNAISYASENPPLDTAAPSKQPNSAVNGNEKINSELPKLPEMDNEIKSPSSSK